jgi:hypothetical protein
MKLLLMILSLCILGCAERSVSDTPARSCVQGRLCESASDTQCYSNAVYEIDPLGIVGDNFVCTKN